MTIPHRSSCPPPTPPGDLELTLTAFLDAENRLQDLLDDLTSATPALNRDRVRALEVFLTTTAWPAVDALETLQRSDLHSFTRAARAVTRPVTTLLVRHDAATDRDAR